MKVKITEEVDDDFKIGECDVCPFSMLGRDFEFHCVMGCPWFDCPIEVEE